MNKAEQRWFWRLNAVAALGLGLVWTLAGYEIDREKLACIHDAEVKTAAHAQVFAEYSGSTIKRIDETLMDTRSNWARYGDGEDFAAAVRHRQEIVSDIAFQVSIIDRRGDVVYSNLGVGASRINIADREHFRVHQRSNGADHLFISDAVFGKVSGKWSIQFTRPLVAHGQFDGIAVISVDPAQFADFAGSMNLSRSGSIAIVKDSGALIARHPAARARLGHLLDSRPFLASGAAISGNFSRVESADGIARIYGWYRVPAYGLAFVAGEPRDAVLAPWLRYRNAAVGLALLVTALGALVHVVLLRWNAERRRVADEMRLASTVYRASGEGMIVTDAEGLIVAVNPAFSVVTGWSPAEVIGRSPAILKSGRHEAEFFAAMWATLASGGRWQGEIWNRRKNGEVFPAWLTINSTPDGEDSKIRHVALFYDISEKKKSEDLIWQQANFDALTGLPNRRMFGDRLEQEIKKSQRSGRSLALMFLDLDRFKEVNDSLGHHYGDRLLIEVASRLAACVRETDTVARLGGDEFTVMMTQLASPDAARRVADEILARLAEPYRLGAEIVFLTTSIGITFCPEDATESEALIKNADQAMFAAKSQGRNLVHWFTPALEHSAQDRLRLVNDLRTALAERQFSVCYQPIVELSSGRIRKAEALLRWRHPVRGWVSPAEFIPVAEDAGLIVEIGNWVFEQALLQVARWRETLDPDFQISVNKSPIQFRGDRSSRLQWPERLREQGLPGSSIVVEITESSLMESSATVIEHLSTFRATGMEISLDDFGTGYSSLSYLKKFDIDFVKIDQSFVRNLGPGSEDLVLCEAIIVMAHKLGIRVVAEGVETALQRELLGAAGCDCAQGYFYSRPVPPEEFERLFGIEPELAREQAPQPA